MNLLPISLSCALLVFARVALGQVVVRINAGGPLIVDSAGNTWIADAYFGGKGATYVLPACSVTVSDTIDDALYCTQRYFPLNKGTPYVYSIPVPASGRYEIRLNFAELVRKLAFANVSSSF